MPEVNIGGIEPTISNPIEPENVSLKIGDTEDLEEKGLTQEEINDANKISVSLSNTRVPIVVLFGAPACGKTMTLVRLTRYLKKEGYIVSPVRSFRPNYDTHYTKMCEGFDQMISSDKAADSTSKVSFMLVDVIKNGKTLCQILEAPGEYYFNKKDPTADFPAYVHAITASNNRKIYTIIVEPDWENESDRLNYVDKIGKLRLSMRPNDRTIFMFNKIDKTNFLIGPGRVHMSEAKSNVEFLYPGIFAKFRNQNPITRFLTPYLCEFLAFQTGTYNRANDGTFAYTTGPDEYPRNYWKLILDSIKG